MQGPAVDIVGLQRIRVGQSQTADPCSSARTCDPARFVRASSRIPRDTQRRGPLHWRLHPCAHRPPHPPSVCKIQRQLRASRGPSHRPRASLTKGEGRTVRGARTRCERGRAQTGQQARHLLPPRTYDRHKSARVLPRADAPSWWQPSLTNLGADSKEETNPLAVTRRERFA